MKLIDREALLNAPTIDLDTDQVALSFARIIACVNFCEGVTTEELMRWKLRDFAEQLEIALGRSMQSLSAADHVHPLATTETP